MAEDEKKLTQDKKSVEDTDEIEELKTFLKKKKVQTVALKKIMAKLNNDENQTSSK